MPAPPEPLLCIRLDEVATLALFAYHDRRRKCYGLLHVSGSLMYDERGEINATEWDTIARMAFVNSTPFIVLYHEWRVVPVRFTDSNGLKCHVHGQVILIPHEDAIATIIEDRNRAPETTLVKDQSPSKRPSGAANRKRARARRV
jgi:hypothetical protein